MSEPRVRVYIASSLDGFIAGENDDLSWLPQDEAAAGPTGEALGFDRFLAEIGSLLMGRRTYEVAAGFAGEWPYGERPVLIASHRPVDSQQPGVRAIEGSITELVEAAKRAAGDRDVYLDGGTLIREALDAGLVDELVVTIVPVVLGRGFPLFAGTEERHTFEFAGHERYGSMLQYRLLPKHGTGHQP